MKFLSEQLPFSETFAELKLQSADILSALQKHFCHVKESVIRNVSPRLLYACTTHMKAFNLRVQETPEREDEITTKHINKNEIELQILSYDLGVVCQSYCMFTNG